MGTSEDNKIENGRHKDQCDMLILNLRFQGYWRLGLGVGLVKCDCLEN